MIMIATMIGTERNIPGIPQTAAQKARLMMIPKDERRSACPISIGSITLPFRNWIAVTTIKMASVSDGSSSCTKAINTTTMVDRIEPILGM
jgi:hypothetical protein